MVVVKFRIKAEGGFLRPLSHFNAWLIGSSFRMCHKYGAKINISLDILFLMRN